MKHFSKLFCFLLAFTLAGSANAQLNPGDIAFVSYDADGQKNISFLALTTIPSGTSIKFTDNGWLSAGGFRANEGILEVTFTSDVDCGTEILFTTTSTGLNIADLQGTSVGTVSVIDGGFTISTGGDQVLAYQGDEANPSFIAAINNEGSGWQADATNANTSALPTGLTDGMTAVALNEIDNAQYGCIPDAGTKAELLAAINNPANWLGSNTSVQAPASCTFAPSDCSSGDPGPGPGADCAELYISEYVEGTGNEKYIEIYNPTPNPVDLAMYELILYSNGASTPTRTSNLGMGGTLASGAVMVFKNASATMFAGGVELFAVNHNGDDAYELFNVATQSTADIFGRIGDDPGSAWTAAGGYSTQNKTLRRIASVTQGVTTNPTGTGSSAFTTLDTEWELLDVNTVDGLGAQVTDCVSDPGPGPGPSADCAELFISEYIEGTSFEKYIEIYNPTPDPVDLAMYELRRYSNGSSTISAASNLGMGGILQSGAVMVFKNSQATGFAGGKELFAINHNGDDAYELFNLATNTTADIFGVIGEDPGSAWTAAGGQSTANKTLRRVASVTQGITVSPTGSGPGGFTTLGTEWEVFDVNTVNGLGIHLGDCVMDPSCLITGVTVTIMSSCDDDESLSQDDDTYMAQVVVTFVNPVQDSDLELFGPGGELAELEAEDISGNEAIFYWVELPANGLPVMLTAKFEKEDCSGDGLAPAVYPCSLPSCTPVINELDYNNPGTDDREFVELYNPCSQAINLADYSVVFVNGANGTFYGNFQLPNVMLAPGDFYVICGNGANTPNCDLDVSPNTNLIQNGDPDAVALFYVQAIADAVSYEGSTTGFTEGSGDGLFDLAAPQLGIGRYTDGVDSDFNNVDFSIQCITPGEPNTNVSQYCTIPEDIDLTSINCAGFNDAVYDASLDQYTISSACAHLYGPQDQIFLVGKETCGNASVSARIVGVFPTNGFGGITMRETDDPGSRKFSIIRYANNQKYVEYRPFANGPYYVYWLPSFTVFADYVRITRWGDYFFAEVSFDGINWMTIYQQYMAGMDQCVEAGMVVSSYFNGITTQAVFQGLEITGSNIAPRPVGPVVVNSDEPVSFNVFPNPTVNELSVTIGNAPEEEATISILGLDGRELYRSVHNINGSTINLPLSGLGMTAGMYILSVNTGKEILTKRFIKANP